MRRPLRRTARGKGNPVAMGVWVICFSTLSSCPCNYNREEPSGAGGAQMGAKSLCIPFSLPKTAPPLEGVAGCVRCGGKAEAYTLFGRSY